MSAELTIYIADIHNKTGMQTQGQVVYCEGCEAVQGRAHETMWALRAQTRLGCLVRNNTIHFQQAIITYSEQRNWPTKGQILLVS